MNKIVELNVGGTYFTTTIDTLTKDENSLLAEWFLNPDQHLSKDRNDRYFIDRDGTVFRFVLEFLRLDRIFLPYEFVERARLRQEAEFFRLSKLQAIIEKPQQVSKGIACITVGYRGTFAFGRDGLADVKFRKLSRILVAGRGSACREVFGDTLNESRDPDRGEEDRYTSRFFLKHNIIEQAFENLFEAGYILSTAAGSGTNSSGGEIKPGQDNEENKWQHYNEFVFVRM